MAETCLCRTLQGPEGPYIAQEAHCPVHGGPQPEFSVMLYGQQYDFYRTSEFSRLIKRSVTKLNHMTNHPARMKDEGRPLWCYQLYIQNLFPKGHVFKTAGGVPVTGRVLRASDFEQTIIAARGGKA